MNTEDIKAFTASEALNEIERAGRLFKAFENAASVLRYMAGLEQRERELNARITKASADAEAAESSAAKWRDDAAKIEQGARQRASEIEAHAEAKRTKILSDAKAEADRMVSETQEAVNRATSRRDAAAADERKVREAADAARKELADTQGRLAAAKAEIDRLLKG